MLRAALIVYPKERPVGGDALKVRKIETIRGIRCELRKGIYRANMTEKNKTFKIELGS